MQAEGISAEGISQLNIDFSTCSESDERNDVLSLYSSSRKTLAILWRNCIFCSSSVQR